MSPRLVPSTALAVYTVRLWLLRTLGVLAMLVIVLMSLDLLGKSGQILERGSCPLRYCSARSSRSSAYTKAAR